MSGDMEIISSENYGKIVKQQRKSKNVLMHELERLQSKKANIDEQEQNAKRMILLNRSYRDKQKSYLIMMTIFLVILGLCLLVIFLQQRMGFSSAIMDWALILIIGIGIVSVYYAYINIWIRDKVDFSKLNSSGLASPSEFKDEYAEQKEKGDLAGMTVNLCKGPECCGPGFSYDGVNHECYTTCPEGMDYNTVSKTCEAAS